MMVRIQPKLETPILLSLFGSKMIFVIPEDSARIFFGPIASSSVRAIHMAIQFFSLSQGNLLSVALTASVDLFQENLALEAPRQPICNKAPIRKLVEIINSN